MEEAPPPYSAAPQNGHFRTSPRESSPKYSQAIPDTDYQLYNDSCVRVSTNNAGQPSHRFPKSFGVYQATRSATDFVITLQANDPQVSFYISSQAITSNQSKIVLHSKSQVTSPPLATANLDLVSKTVAIKIFDNSSTFIEAQSACTPQSIMMFLVLLPGTNRQEKFAWKVTQIRVRVLSETKMHELQLINCRTGDLVAVWRRASFSLSPKKMGKMNFLADDRKKLGERFELMAVVTLLAILEGERRKIE